MSHENIAIFVKDGRIVVHFAQGNLQRDSINLAAQIKRLPDVASATIQRSGNILITLSSASNVPALQRQIADLVDNTGAEPVETEQSAQLSLF